MALLRKVQSGDPLVIAAADYNACLDAARAHRSRPGLASGAVESLSANSGILLVKNVSGQDQPRFAVLGITGPLVKPTENPSEFYGRVVLKAGVPQDNHVARFVVLLEPLKANAVGRACVDGVCAVKVKMNAESDGCAEVKTGQCDKLESATAGSAVLLWVQPQSERSDPTVAWTLARLSGGSGGLIWQWAKVTVVQTSDFKAKLADAQGNPTGDEFTVKVLGATAGGLSSTPAMATCVPKLNVNAIVRVVQLPVAAGPDYPAGWWLYDLVFDTCYA